MASIRASKSTAFALSLALVQASDIMIPSTEQCGSSSSTLPIFPQICPLPLSDDVSSEPSSWAPWTHRPYCAETPYCVYTNAAFQSRGISIIASPTAISDALHQFTNRSLNSTPYIPQYGNDGPPHEVRPIPGKGMGLIATRKIRKGEVFMVDYAAILADVEFPSRVKRRDGGDLMLRAVDQLAAPETLLDLATSGPADEDVGVHVEDVLRTNTFGASVNGGRYMALFPNISRMNHACNPSAFTRFSEKTLANHVVAFRDIEPGEEITISYSEFGLTYQERQDILLRRWGFKCTCKMCSASPKIVSQSDDRRTRIKALRKDILSNVVNNKLRVALALNQEMMDLVVEEGLVAHLGEHYEVMARLSYNIGEYEDAERYGLLALADLREFGGPEVYDSIRDLESLLSRL